MTGIKPKEKPSARQFSEHAKRYVFYPLSNLDFAATQFLSPIWNPRFPKARFVLLESLEYASQVVDETEDMVGSQGIKLGTRVMGTDAQVKFLMGNADGTAYMDKGMAYLESLTDIDPQTALEVEAMILPIANGEVIVLETVVDLEQYLKGVRIEGETPVHDLARKTLVEVREGVNRAIIWCRKYTAELEKELADGLAGRAGIRSIDPTNQYYFDQIKKPLPSEKASGGASIEKLAQILQQGLSPQTQVNSLESQADKDLIERLQKELKEKEEIIETLTEEEEKD